MVTMGALGRLAARHLPSGPVDPPFRWAATSNGQTTYPVNRRRVRMEGREGSDEQSQKRIRIEGEEQGSGARR